MATPIHGRVAEPKGQEAPLSHQDGPDSLKNGTTFDDSEDSNGGNMVVKGRNQQQPSHGRDSAAENFQDGGSAANSSRSANDSASPYSAEPRAQMNSDFQSYNNQSTNRDDDFRNANPPPDGYNHGGCDVGYAARGYDPAAHGAENSPNSQNQNKMYPQYGQMRPSYAQSPRNMGMGPQQRGPNVHGYPGNNSQQRFLSGPSISQQAGPTPTLNQLLQAPNSLQRYHNSYDYNNSNQGLHKNVGDQAPPPSQYPGPNNSWPGVRPSSGYPQQMAPSMYRNQGGPMSEPSMKRSYGPGGGGPMSGSPSGPAPQQGVAQQQQYPQQYHSYGQQQQQSPQSVPPVRPPISQSYQQGVQQSQQQQQQQQQQQHQYSNVPRSPTQQSQPQTPGYDHSRQQMPSYGSQSHMQQPLPPSQQQQQQQQPPQQSPHQQQPQRPPSQPQQIPQTVQPAPQTPTPPQSQQQSAPQATSQQQPMQQSPQDVSGSNSNSSSSVGAGPTEDGPPAEPSSASGGLRTPPTPPHPVVSPHRPVPSPSGPPTAASPSMSPVIGQQQSIPPRPASGHSENNANQSPGTPQGYSQQMAPPAMYGSKMHQGMMGNTGSHMGSYPPQSSGHYPQSSYHRPPNVMGMQGYGGQSQNSYQSPASNPNYPPQSSVPHRMPTHPGSGPPSYNSPSPSGYPNSQYGNSGPPPSSGYPMNNMMPPPNQYPKSSTMPPPTGGAQAAAQAAVIAAAASSTGFRQSPMYLRQHLQQKMYSGSYSNASMSPVPPGASGMNAMGPSESTPMPPPSTTPSSQSMGIGQTSPMPPQVSTPGAMASCDNSMPNSMALAGFTQTSAPSLGPLPTTITQSISSPVPSAVTVSSPSVMGSDMMQGRGPMGGPQGPLPPPIMDEGSQASNASASSSLPEERVETPKPNNKPAMSHPPTPNTLSSPGAASMSSFHDEFESVSSPSWPRTPASPVINNQAYDHHPIKRPDGMLKLYDMSDDPERRLFLDKLIMYNEERGTPISQCPTISKQPLDLYRLYMACKERGGFVEVMKSKMWKDIAGIVGIGASSSAAYTLRKQYIKHLLPFECKYDRGGIDPAPLISSLESNSRKKNVQKNAMMSNQEGYHQGGPMMDGYGSPYPGQYPSSGPHPGMMSNTDYPGHHGAYNEPMHPGGAMVNHSGSEGSMDPFSDEMPSTQYSQRHSATDGYGYSQSPANSGIPPYSGNQTNIPPSNQYAYGNSAPGSQPEMYGDQYAGRMGPPASDSNYSNRNMVSDPYAPPGGYPPNRTVGPTNPPTYPPYQSPCDQDRYEQSTPQSPMMRPPSSTGMGPSPTQDPSAYSPHRYPNQHIASRDGMPPQQMGSYQGGRPSMSQSPYPGPNSQTSGQASTYPQSQQDFRNPEYPPPQMSRLQSTLIQRLQPKNHSVQNYPSNQQGMYGQSMPPPNKIAPPANMTGSMYQRDMYSMGPKRHGDFTKPHGPNQDQYHMANYPQQTQGPYSDRPQYPYRPTHGMPPSSGPQPGWTRDGRPYPTAPGQYQSNHRDAWDVSRHGDGPPQSPGVWPRYGGPQADPYAIHQVGPKMSLNRGYMPPNKMNSHPGVGPPPQYGPSSMRKEIIFPPDSVEGVTPVMTKRRRMLAKDLPPVDPWRLMMALKSGLLCESTWALDILSVLICDDTTVLYFGLSHLPGLLEVLMDHYRCCLNQVFDLVGDLEIGFMTEGVPYVKPLSKDKKEERKWYELERDFEVPEEYEVHTMEVDNSDKVSVLNTANYTNKTRCRKIVKLQQEEALFLFDPDKKWDVYEGFMSGSSHWQHGGGESTKHIQTHFENNERNVRFVRLLKDVSNSEELRTQNQDKLGMTEACNKQYCKKDCNSDTEEDESLCVGSPHSHAENPKNVTKECCELSESEKENVKCELHEKDTNCDVFNDDDKKDHPTPAEAEEAPVVEYPRIRSSAPNCKRKAPGELEDESYNRDEPSLCITNESQDSLTKRCICISSVLRNLSFVPGNDTEMSKHAGFLMVIGRILLLHHVHAPRKPSQRHYDRDEDNDSTSVADSCSSLNCDNEWWWEMLHLLRENTLVTLANISGQLDLAPFPEEISFPLLDGLMHWVTCPSSYSQDPLPTQPSHSVLSPQRLSLEALCKLSVLESNVDLMMATPPWRRIDRFFSLLAKWLSRNEDQVLREFSVVLLSNLSQADSSMARAIALQGTCIPLLITFVEQAEQSALQVANSQGINALRENPELMGTTLDMVRRAAGTLRCLARVPSNRTLFLQHQQRLLALVMSQILDQGVASIIADVLFECSQDNEEDYEKPSASSLTDNST